MGPWKSLLLRFVAFVLRFERLAILAPLGQAQRSALMPAQSAAFNLLDPLSATHYANSKKCVSFIWLDTPGVGGH